MSLSMEAYCQGTSFEAMLAEQRRQRVEDLRWSYKEATAIVEASHEPLIQLSEDVRRLPGVVQLYSAIRECEVRIDAEIALLEMQEAQMRRDQSIFSNETSTFQAEFEKLVRAVEALRNKMV